MQTTKRITRLSNGLYWITSALLVATPIVAGAAFWHDWADPSDVLARVPDLPDLTQMTRAKLIWLAAIGVAGTIPVLLTFWNMRGLLRHYRNGDIVSPDCVRRILHIGGALLAMALWGVLGRTLQLLALTYDNPAGSKILTFGIEGSSLGLALAGGVLITIGWVMGEASREIESFV